MFSTDTVTSATCRAPRGASSVAQRAHGGAAPGGRLPHPPRATWLGPNPWVALLVALVLCAAMPALAEDLAPEDWVLVEGRTQVRVHRWSPRCGERPAPGSWSDARYVRRGTALLPVDDAPPVFGPGICRALVSTIDSREAIEAADITCEGADGSTGRAALRQLQTAVLTVVHQVRRTPGEGCVAEVTGTWLLRQADAPVAEDPEKARPGSRLALAPIPPPAPRPASVSVPRRTVVDATARALPAPDPPVAGSRLPLFGLAGLLFVVGVAGWVRSARRGG